MLWCNFYIISKSVQLLLQVYKELYKNPSKLETFSHKELIESQIVIFEEQSASSIFRVSI